MRFVVSSARLNYLVCRICFDACQIICDLDRVSVVGRIDSELQKRFPTRYVFLDHDSIPHGTPFIEVIRV